jgi:hypothetical protein
VKRINSLAALAAAVMLAAAGPAIAQSSGASPADPNNERNQTPAPSNTQPADPAAGSNPGARVPTAPGDRREAQGEEGGATGTRPAGAMPAPVPPPATPPQ